MSEEELERALVRQWAWLAAGRMTGFMGRPPWFFKRKMFATLWILGLIKE